jgi:hypothetical protein
MSNNNIYIVGDYNACKATPAPTGSVTSIIEGEGINTDTPINDVTINSTGINSLTSGSGISLTNTTGDITINNTYLTQLNGSEGISVDVNNGANTITNLGITNVDTTKEDSGITVDVNNGVARITNTGISSLVAGINGIEIGGNTINYNSYGGENITINQGAGYAYWQSPSSGVVILYMTMYVDVFDGEFTIIPLDEQYFHPNCLPALQYNFIDTIDCRIGNNQILLTSINGSNSSGVIRIIATGTTELTGILGSPFNYNGFQNSVGNTITTISSNITPANIVAVPVYTSSNSSITWTQNGSATLLLLLIDAINNIVFNNVLPNIGDGNTETDYPVVITNANNIIFDANTTYSWVVYTNGVDSTCTNITLNCTINYFVSPL